jgi:DMSO/TMAO reductase YedYZ molybdopterin-dependent catalytic subunit
MTFMTYTRLFSGILLLAGFFACFASAQTTTPAATPIAAAELTIRGDISETLVLKTADLTQLPHETVAVADQDGTQISYEGIPLREILKRAGLPVGKDLRGKSLASYIVAKAHDGYQVVFSLGELGTDFGNESILVADKRDGKPLFGYQGPLRLVCPNDKAGARSVRMLETIEFVRLQK